MLKRLPYLLMLFLALAVPLRGSPPTGVVVQTWRYDPASSNIILRLVNTSGKDVTGWTIKIKETYDNGQINEHEYSSDILNLMLTVQQNSGTVDGENLRSQFGNGTFQAGTSRDEKIPVAHPVKDFEAAITVVLYADKTAEATNHDALDRALSARKVAASTMKTASDIIKKALATSATPDVDAAAQLSALETQWKSQRHTSYDLDTGVLEGVIRALGAAPQAAAAQNITVKQRLNDYLIEQDKRASTLSDHSKLVVGGAQ
jgi:hypothetical protein